MRKTISATAACAAALALALGGCAGGQHTYTDIHGQPIPNQEFQAYLNELDDYAPNGEFTTDQAMLATIPLVMQCDPLLRQMMGTGSSTSPLSLDPEASADIDRIVKDSATPSLCQYVNTTTPGGAAPAPSEYGF